MSPGSTTSTSSVSPIPQGLSPLPAARVHTICRYVSSTPASTPPSSRTSRRQLAPWRMRPPATLSTPSPTTRPSRRWSRSSTSLMAPPPTLLPGAPWPAPMATPSLPPSRRSSFHARCVSSTCIPMRSTSTATAATLSRSSAAAPGAVSPCAWTRSVWARRSICTMPILS